jgi:hypothetical protein
LAEGHHDLRKELTDERHQQLLAKNGSWWLHVELAKAEAAGNHKRAKQLQAKIDAKFARSWGRVRRAVGKRP